MDIKDWQDQVDQWIKQYGVRYFDIMTNTLLLNEEAGEFSRLIARKYGEQSFKVEQSDEETMTQIKDEIGDMLFVITCLSNQLDIDLSAVLTQNLHKKSHRDVHRHRTNPKLG